MVCLSCDRVRNISKDSAAACAFHRDINIITGEDSRSYISLYRDTQNDLSSVYERLKREQNINEHLRKELKTVRNRMRKTQTSLRLALKEVPKNVREGLRWLFSDKEC